MIELEKEFVSGAGGFSNDPLTYTQIKRNDKAAVYMRSRNGVPYDYETFLIKVKPKGTKIFQKILEDDMECYPSCSQFGKIAWSYSHLGVALYYFREISNGNLLKEEPIDEEDSNSCDDATVPISSVTPPTVEKSEDSEGEEGESKPYKGPDLLIPVGEFSTKELAEHNNVQYPIAFLFLKEQERKGKIKFSRKERRAAKGKPTSLFQLNPT